MRTGAYMELSNIMSKSQSNRLTNARNGSTIIWTRGTGERFLSLELTKIPGIMQAMECGGLAAEAIRMGLAQTVGDAGAMNRTDAAGKIIPEMEFWSEKKRRMLARVEALYRGEWYTKPEGAETTLLRDALAILAAKSAKAGEYLARFDEMDDETKKKLRAAPSIKAEMDRLRMERAPKGGDEMLDDLLGE